MNLIFLPPFFFESVVHSQVLSSLPSSRIFLSYESRKSILESELASNPNRSDLCGCAPSDGSFPKASDPTCEFVKRREVFKFLWLVLLHFFLFYCFYLKILQVLIKIIYSNSVRTCLDWTAFLTSGHHLPPSIRSTLSAITSPEECYELVVPFVFNKAHNLPR